ncbi:MAG: PAS domain-containing protein, partial [Candidatus Eremiobacteraeota bacterium]|nr:PAS domain-containing protein [Candidatus Eremiobacteraeota bacterium]
MIFADSHAPPVVVLSGEQAAVDGFQTFAEALPCIVWIADAAGEIEWYNQAFGEYTGLTLQAAVGRG